MKHRLRLRVQSKENARRLSRWVSVFGIGIVLSLSLDFGLLFAASFGLADRVVEQKLANGLTVLMVERHQTPVVSLNMTFRVGGVNEQVGQTGLAHLYEHMAFKGTRTVGTKNYEKERPILEELYRVGTELEQRQRELARRSLERPASSEDRAAIERLQKRFTEYRMRHSIGFERCPQRQTIRRETDHIASQILAGRRIEPDSPMTLVE